MTTMLAAGVNWFHVLVVQGGVIGWVIWAMNITLWGLIVKFLMDFRRESISPDTLRLELDEMFEARQYREVLERTEDDPSTLGFIMHSAMGQANYGYGAMERALEEAAEDRLVRMMRNIEWLNLIGNIGPMLGLMGTVLGMIMAFFDIVAAGGSPDPAGLAGSIGVALVTTLLGLIVAVPALSAYAIFRNKIDASTTEALIASQEMISVFRPTPKRG